MSDIKYSEVPQHEHDCDHCVFLGRFGLQDLYFHDGGRVKIATTVIARHGPYGAYSSGLWASRPYRDISGAQQPGIPELVEARRRAVDIGFREVIERTEAREQ